MNYIELFLYPVKLLVSHTVLGVEKDTEFVSVQCAH